MIKKIKVKIIEKAEKQANCDCNEKKTCCSKKCC